MGIKMVLSILKNLRKIRKTKIYTDESKIKIEKLVL